MRRWVCLLILIALAAIEIGCATTRSDENVSTIPWNRPQNWEGSGAFGGMRPPGQ